MTRLRHVHLVASQQKYVLEPGFFVLSIYGGASWSKQVEKYSKKIEKVGAGALVLQRILARGGFTNFQKKHFLTTSTGHRTVLLT
jgi:hypothetical protein